MPTIKYKGKVYTFPYTARGKRQALAFRAKIKLAKARKRRRKY